MMGSESRIAGMARRMASSRGLVATAVTAATLAATAAWVARRARQAEYRDPPKGAFVSVDDVRLHYVERGEGPAVVLLHGNVVRLEDFMASGLIERLAARHRVIAFDRPGFGYSERPRDRLWTANAQASVIARALVRLGVEQPIVLGHSWGALVALALALQDPAAVRKLVLVSGYYFPTARLDVVLASPPAIPIIGDVMRYTVDAVLARALLRPTVKAMFAPMPVPQDFMEMLGREILVRPLQLRANAEDAVFMLPSVATLRKHYSELRIPAVILAGDADKAVDPDAHSRRLHAELRNSELRIVPGVGHMLHYAVPEVLMEAVAAPEIPTLKQAVGTLSRRRVLGTH
jgi:pimeloyl-ACP methyl ester carboxylesterase